MCIGKIASLDKVFDCHYPNILNHVGNTVWSLSAQLAVLLSTCGQTGHSTKPDHPTKCIFFSTTGSVLSQVFEHT